MGLADPIERVLAELLDANIDNATWRVAVARTNCAVPSGPSVRIRVRDCGPLPDA